MFGCYDEIAHLYDSEFPFEEDLNFYLKFLPLPPSLVLELGCGTGRISIPLARKGYRVVGIDISIPMLKHAKQKSKKGLLPFYPVCMDVECIGFKKRFDCILMPFGVLHFVRGAKQRCVLFKQAFSLLNHSGRLLIDLFNSSFPSQTKREFKKEFTYKKAGTLIVKHTKEVFQNNQIIVRQTYYEYEYGTFHPKNIYKNFFILTLVTLPELEKELLETGFWIEEKFGDYAQNAFSIQTSPRLLVVARPLV